MSAEVWDCIVIGGGVVGSWAGYHLAIQGTKTLILDQFFLPHTRGSSGGHSRLFSNTSTDPGVAIVLAESYRQWYQLQRTSNQKLFEPTGHLLVQNEGTSFILDDTHAAMDKANADHKLLGPRELREQFPDLVYDDKHRGLLDVKGGLLLASRCLKVVQEEFVKAGGVIQDGVKVDKIVPGSTVTLTTTNGTYLAKKLVITAGPWALDVLSSMGIKAPLKTMPGMSVYFKERSSSTSPSYTPAQGFPTILSYLHYKPGNYRFVATFPSMEYPGMVKMVTRGEPPPYYCHPDDRDTRGSDDLVNILVKYVSEHLPHLDPTPAIMEPGVYTMTPDRKPIIDRHPGHKNIVLGAGFSGNGFMEAPMIGQILMELAIDKRPSIDISRWRMERYAPAKL